MTIAPVYDPQASQVVLENLVPNWLPTELSDFIAVGYAIYMKESPRRTDNIEKGNFGYGAINFDSGIDKSAIDLGKYQFWGSNAQKLWDNFSAMSGFSKLS